MLLDGSIDREDISKDRIDYYDDQSKVLEYISRSIDNVDHQFLVQQLKKQIDKVKQSKHSLTTQLITRF